MKIAFMEHDGCFSLDLTAETVQDAAHLARLGLTAKKEVRLIHAYPDGDGTFTASVVIGKSTIKSSTISL